MYLENIAKPARGNLSRHGSAKQHRKALEALKLTSEELPQDAPSKEDFASVARRLDKSGVSLQSGLPGIGGAAKLTNMQLRRTHENIV